MVTRLAPDAQILSFVHINHTFCGLLHPIQGIKQGNRYPKKQALSPTKHPNKPRIARKCPRSPTIAKDSLQFQAFLPKNRKSSTTAHKPQRYRQEKGNGGREKRSRRREKTT
jgi:hypothetical protein